MSELLCHLFGDYIIQSDWMATQKTERWWPAFMHGWTYTIPFLFLTTNMTALLIICVSHIIIDRFRLARYVVWLKNFLAPIRKSEVELWNPSFAECRATGYPPDRPTWLTVWLMIIADNTMHLTINHFALMLK